jgi:hypothetical protein
MSDLPPELARMPSWAEAVPPWPGSWCRACHGTHALVDGTASLEGLAVHEVPSAGSSADRGDPQGRGGR